MSDVRELLRRSIDPAEYDAIRELWKQHSKAEDRRDIAGLLATLTDDCVYELVGTEHGGRATRARRASTQDCSARSRTSTSS